MTTSVVILVLVLLAIAAASPRLRVAALVPVLCVALGWYLASQGLMPAFHQVIDQVDRLIGHVNSK
jgi:hypothetical protein